MGIEEKNIQSQKRILLIISGGIAAYKSLELIRRLRENNYEVRCVITESGKQFVTPLSVASLTSNQVISDLFDADNEAQFSHIELARWADLILIAPATANFIAKVANGFADELSSTLILATTSEVVFVPAMNVRMWENSATQTNLDKILELGYSLIGPNQGEMACGEFGFGRMAEPQQIINEVEAKIFQKKIPKRKKLTAIVTSGPTIEQIDPIRYISNHSSGRQGVEIANALLNKGFTVKLISGPSEIREKNGITRFNVKSAEEMYQSVFREMPCDVFVSVAAVSDWKIKDFSPVKLKKSSTTNELSLKFEKNKDILAEVSIHKTARPKLVVGFAAETTNLSKNAKEKLKQKKCDWIVANKVGGKTEAMGGNRNTVSILTNSGVVDFPPMSKRKVADNIANLILEHFLR